MKQIRTSWRSIWQRMFISYTALTDQGEDGVEAPLNAGASGSEYPCSIP